MAWAIKTSAFSGIRPKIEAHHLGDGEAQAADNCKLYSGALRSWNRPSDVDTPSKATLGTVRTIFRLNYNSLDYWLNWTKDVDVQRGPVAGDELQRIYYTGDGEPRMSYGSLATQSGADYPVAAFVLGVFAPTAAASLSVSGGGGAVETRSYVYTFKTTLGEESQPSPPITVSGFVNGSWDLSAMQVAPLNTFVVTAASWSAGIATLTMASTRGLRIGEEVNVTGMNPAGYNASKAVITDVTATTIKYALTTNPGAFVAGGAIARVAPHNTSAMTKLVYRALAGTAGAEFQLVTEIPVANTTYSDTTPAASLGTTVLPSTSWEMPPTDMKGLGTTAGGIMFAFSGNDLCFSEPFRPHAWPSEYRVPFQRAVVGAKAYSGGIVVGTKGKPASVTGSTPDSMTPSDVETNDPCLSKTGMVGMGFGAIYPSPNGFVLSGIGGTVVASEDVVEMTKFKDFFPATMIAVCYRDKYFAWYTDSMGVVRGLIFDRSGQGPVLVPLQQAADAAWVDPETAELYIVHEGKIKLFDGDTLNALPYAHGSKIFTIPRPLNPSAAQVRAKYSDLGGDFAAAQAQKAVDAAFNAALLAAVETWPGQGKTRGEFDSNMLEEFMLEGSLLRDSEFSIYDNRTLQFQLYALDEDPNSATIGTFILKHTENLTGPQPFRLPDGYVTSEIEYAILGNIEATEVAIADSMRTLKGV